MPVEPNMHDETTERREEDHPVTVGKNTTVLHRYLKAAAGQSPALASSVNEFEHKYITTKLSHALKEAEFQDHQPAPVSHVLQPTAHQLEMQLRADAVSHNLAHQTKPPPPEVSSVISSTLHDLDRQIKTDTVKHQLANRHTATELRHRGVIPTKPETSSRIAAPARELEKQMTRDKLETSMVSRVQVEQREERRRQSVAARERTPSTEEVEAVQAVSEEPKKISQRLAEYQAAATSTSKLESPSHGRKESVGGVSLKERLQAYTKNAFSSS